MERQLYTPICSISTKMEIIFYKIFTKDFCQCQNNIWVKKVNTIYVMSKHII